MQQLLVPIYTTTLIGRLRETSEVVALINEPTIKVVTLTGTSGTGKTRLSIEVITELTKQDHKVIFVPLAAINKPEYVIPTLAQQLDVHESGSVELIDLVIEHLRQEPAIIVLDNFEQVVTAASQLEKIIQADAPVTFLITSQVPLELTAETIYDIPGLDVPETIPETPEEALQYASIQLFVQRIQGAQPNFQLDETNLEPVVEVCQMLEGLPLAIEIVAAHSGVLFPHDLKLLVRQHLMLYRFRSKGATGRQRIILPIIEWSLLRLPEHGQVLFNHLGVFKGGWMFEALQSVVHEHANLQESLELLANRHLILKQTVNDTEIRYMMLDAVQDFANTHFTQLPFTERTTYVQRHMSFMQELLSEAEADLLNGVKQPFWMSRLNQEMPNIRFLLEWALEHDPNQAAVLGQYLGRFWYIAGHWKEGVSWLSQIYQQAEPTVAQLAKIAANYTMLLGILGNYVEAEHIGEIGINKAQEAGDRYTEGRLYNTLGLLSLRKKSYKSAKQYLEKSVQAAKDINNLAFLSISLGNLAIIDLNERNYSSALQRYKESLDIARSSGQKMSEIVLQCNIGSVYIAMRQPESAIEPLNEVIEAAQVMQIKELHAVSLYYKAQALLLLEAPGIKPLLQESIEILSQIDSIYLYHALDTVAGYLQKQGANKSAGLVIGAVDQIRKDIQNPRSQESDEPNPILDDLLKHARNSKTFEHARKEGQTWNRQQVIKFALQELTSVNTT